MNHNDLLTLVRQPEKLTNEYIADLKELMVMYPAFVPARILYTKALQLTNNVHFGSNLKLATLYSGNKRWLYYYMHPEKKLSAEPYRRENTINSHGDYFDMIEALEREGGDIKQSLKNLAERLKSARALVIGNTDTEMKSNVKVQKQNSDMDINKSLEPEKPESLEIIAKKMIQEKKYIDAIEILRKLNLNNPKKSVYFADQIRFLEKVIANSKK